MRVVLGKFAHPKKSVQNAAFFVAMHDAVFEKFKRQIAVRADVALIDLDVADAVHRLYAVFCLVDRRKVHIFFIVCVVAALFPHVGF